MRSLRLKPSNPRAAPRIPRSPTFEFLAPVCGRRFWVLLVEACFGLTTVVGSAAGSVGSTAGSTGSAVGSVGSTAGSTGSTLACGRTVVVTVLSVTVSDPLSSSKV